MKILVADDNPLWRGMLSQNVESWGHEPVVAENGSQAWEILQREDAPRLAILDWQMPGMDGIDVCRKIKRDPNYPFTYIVMLTSRDAQEDMVAGLDAGADDYLTKPIKTAILKSRIKAAERIVRLVPPKEWAMPRVEGYEVKHLLGKGVFATVWEAVRLETGETVALKIIRVDLATEEVFGRFAREVELMKKLDHPHIASIYDSQINKNLCFYSMELMPGGTFEHYVKTKQPKPAILLYQIAKVCKALDHAHRQGVVHRDLKPSNIMMSAEGEPKILDFGLACSMFKSNDADSSLQSMDGTIIGTPLFMSPEQARGENDTIDGRADVYALGTIMYVMLVRKHPHKINRSDRWETIREIATGKINRPSDVRPGFNPDLEKIILRSLSSRREDRYPTAGELGKAIEGFLKDQIRAQRDAASS